VLQKIRDSIIRRSASGNAAELIIQPSTTNKKIDFTKVQNMGILNNDNDRYGFEEGGVLTQETLKGMNENPAILLSGMTAAVEAKQREYNDAVKNKNQELADSLNEEINALDEQRILLQNKLSERGGMKDGGPGIEALRKVAPEVVERMGYEEGGDVEKKTYPILSGVPGEDPEAVKELVAFMDKVGNKSNEVIDNIVIPHIQKTNKSFKEGLDYIGNKIAESGKPLVEAIKDLEERFKKAEGGNVDEQMSMLMGPQQELPEMEMEPDSEMEDNYLDFIINEALSEEEEDMLMSKLEQDDELSMLFDKVIEVASEFAGSGPVEGPGTGVSDSIPARLSDGEFVFTAKAVEEIGADNLMAMMKDAEMKADERQEMQMGGLMARNTKPEDEMNPYAIAKDELDNTDDAIKRGMIYNQIPIR